MSEGWSSWGACVLGRKDGPGPDQNKKISKAVEGEMLPTPKLSGKARAFMTENHDFLVLLSHCPKQ